MDALRALGPLPEGVEAEVDEDELRVFVRRDMLHLDADALHDRLLHWTQTTLARVMPSATASVSFRSARPADPHEEATLDLQEWWMELEPTLAMELGGAGEREVRRFAALIPEWLKLVEGKGRPAGYRSPDVGSME